ncbi:MAG: Protein translocase subunit SecDF [Calditrichaeota bacterium]|nr:Protein translocase subunit SecDF [Calditrichota bacterium]
MKGPKLFRTLLILALIVLALVNLYPTIRNAQLDAELTRRLQRISDATGTPVEILREDIFRFDVDLVHRIRSNEQLTEEQKDQFAEEIQQLRSEFFPEYDETADKSIKLGLDLQGGMHLVLEVSLVDLMDRLAKNTDATYRAIADTVRQRLDADPTLSFDDVVAEEFERRDVPMARYFGDPRQSNREIIRTLETQAEEAVDLTLTKLRNRIDEFGVSEPSITSQGSRRIVVELPGVQDPSRARSLIGRTALLEFQLVADAEMSARVIQDLDNFMLEHEHEFGLADFGADAAGDTLAAPDTAGDEQLTTTEKLFGDQADTAAAEEPSRFDASRPFSSLLSLFGRQIVVLDEDRDKVEQILGREDVRKLIPPEYEFLWSHKSMEDQQGRDFWYLYLLREQPELTGNALADAQVTIGSGSADPTQAGQAIVNLTMKREGTRTFARVTENNVGNQLAIVLDERVHMAPNIRSRIPDGRAIIEGIESVEEANDIAIVLRAGALPAPVVIIEERTVGPSLGEDSIRAGSISAVVGLIIVMIFMIFYYRGSGVIADIALILTMIFLMAVLAGFGFTLTLPGIAGIILTIGMAVDANVLVFERIREELRAGKTVWNAVKNGFDRALVTILDANITTMIAAIVLYQFGTGPIRGFALTLMIGITASVFTALVVSRAIFDYLTTRWSVRKLSV